MSYHSMVPNPQRKSLAMGATTRWLLLPVAAVLALIVSLLPAEASDDSTQTGHFADAYSNHYKCYEAKETDQLEPEHITLKDQFGSGRAVALRVQMLCNPVSKNDEEVPDPDTHLVCFEIVQDLEAIDRKVLVENQFGKRTLIVEQSQLLCLPSSKIEL